MTESSQGGDKKKPIWRRYVLWGMPIGAAAAVFIAGIVFWGGFNTAMEATNTKEFCISCHEMRDFVFQEYTGTIHDVNRSGVGATCSDCHVPKDWTHKIIRKIKASRELWGKMTGSIATKEKFEAKRVHLAMNEWERMKANDSRECRNCHGFDSMMPEFQKPRARQQHLNAMETGQTCIDCHKGIAHSDLRDRADPDYIEKIETPNPAFKRDVPEEYIASLKYITEKEAEEEAAKLVNEDDIKAKAIERVEQHGIVFLDELDKVTRRSETSGPDVSREGVQRDLLPLVEGSTVSTRYGMVKTDHILFIASGAFHLAKPSDLIPELQGRLPIRVELSALVTDDFIRILTEPDASLTEQYTALMATEGVGINFTEDGIQRIAEIAWQVNEATENIGARRLHTVMERLLETLSFEASEKEGESISIDAVYVNDHLNELVGDEDLSRYIL